MTRASHSFPLFLQLLSVHHILNLTEHKFSSRSPFISQASVQKSVFAVFKSLHHYPGTGSLSHLFGELFRVGS